mmetsp:Transcript_15753/g.32937  ORF Transcript_15753/g.32937 Transcript_15753/m.32937 type:complete len:456 (+) Transcript_15753:63-1430(+)
MIKIQQSVLFLVVGAASMPRALSGYCNWGPDGTDTSSTCNLDVQGGPWCNESQGNCESGCGGRWCTNDAGYCNWGPDGTGASSTCNGEAQGGTWCNEGKTNCVNCGGKWCSSGGPNPPTATPPPPTPPTGSLTATTTRYWDCSGGACGCSFLPTGQSEPVHCHSNAMFAAPAGNAYGAKFYGAAAISTSLGGGNWMAQGCGKCWRVTGKSNVAGFNEVETTVVLKGTNYCPDDNPMCAAGPHFDIAAPGFDVLAFSFANTCSEREPEEAEGFSSCGNWLIDPSKPDYNTCNCGLFKSPILRAGCENFYSLKWDNPSVTYEEVACPSELAELHCNYPYATEENMPSTCESNSSTDGTTTTTSTTTTSTKSTTIRTTTTSTSSSATTSVINSSYCCSWYVFCTIASIICLSFCSVLCRSRNVLKCNITKLRFAVRLVTHPLALTSGLFSWQGFCNLQ